MLSPSIIGHPLNCFGWIFGRSAHAEGSLEIRVFFNGKCDSVEKEALLFSNSI